MDSANTANTKDYDHIHDDKMLNKNSDELHHKHEFRYYVLTLIRYWYCCGFLSRPRCLRRSSSPPSINW